MMILNLKLMIFCYVFPFISTDNEVFSAVVHLKQLYKDEKSMLENFVRFIDEKENEIHKYRKIYLQYRNALEENIKLANDNIRDISSMNSVNVQDSNKMAKEGYNDNDNEDDDHKFNPINAFLLIKRMTHDGNFIKFHTKNIPEDNQHEFVGLKDFEGAIDAILRLQETYQLKTSDLVSGKISTSSINNPYTSGEEIRYFYSGKLNANDCANIAYQAFQSSKFIQAIYWYEKALELADLGIIHYQEKSLSSLKTQIIEMFSLSLFKKKFFVEANQIYQRILEYSQMTPKIYNNLKSYQYYTKDKSNRFRSGDAEFEIDASRNKYEALCRGEILLSRRVLSKLKCFYLETRKLKDFYFRLWRIGVEEAGLKPKIWQFHDVIYDHEIEVLKTFAHKNLTRARVAGMLTKGNVTKARTSQSSWAKDHDHEIVRKLSRRIQGLTGLNLANDSSEALQMGNYGIGGHYSPHFDYFQSNNFTHPNGNRIATWMFYLSDVTLGGATVFPAAGVTVWPKKGSAAFWYNLDSSGKENNNTLHGGCPVLIGSKWVANKWIHEKGQEFHKPCNKRLHLKQVKLY